MYGHGVILPFQTSVSINSWIDLRTLAAAGQIPDSQINFRESNHPLIHANARQFPAGDGSGDCFLAESKQIGGLGNGQVWLHIFKQSFKSIVPRFLLNRDA